jgi:hypothetical protein
MNMGSLSWRACSPRDASLSIIGFEDEMTWSRPGSVIEAIGAFNRSHEKKIGLFHVTC